MGYPDVGKKAMGSFGESVIADVKDCEPVTSMTGSVCGLPGESIYGLDFARLLVDGLEVPKDAPLLFPC